MIEQAMVTILFYGFAAAAILLALAVTISRNLLRAAVCLMGVLSIQAAFYILLAADFLAGVQVLVYVGGIVVVIAFVITLTRSSQLLMDSPSRHRKLLAAVVAVGFAVISSASLWMSAMHRPSVEQSRLDSTRAIGLALLDTGGSGYVLPFEVISVLLLAAMIGGIVIARKTPPSDQPFTSRGDQPGEADAALPKSQRPLRDGRDSQ
jgi:NADH-quinone oxidoreductase subunit J